MNLYMMPVAPNPTKVRLYVAEHLCRWDENYRARSAARATLTM